MHGMLVVKKYFISTQILMLSSELRAECSLFKIIPNHGRSSGVKMWTSPVHLQQSRPGCHRNKCLVQVKVYIDCFYWKISPLSLSLVAQIMAHWWVYRLQCHFNRFSIRIQIFPSTASISSIQPSSAPFRPPLGQGLAPTAITKAGQVSWPSATLVSQYGLQYLPPLSTFGCSLI